MGDIVERLRNARMMVNYGHGDVRDEPDPLHEEAAKEIERLQADNVLLLDAIEHAHSEGSTWPARFALPIARMRLTTPDSRRTG